jgi:hypothetical protein
MPAGVLTHSGLLVEMPTWEAAPAGVSQEWTSQPAGTAINSFWGASGPWEPASGAQTITVQSASVVSGKEVTIPVWATVAGVVGTLTQPGAALQPILVDADGCVSPSAAKVELPAVGAGANVRRLPRWLIRDTGPLQWKLESTAAGVVSYAPFYVVPPLPPTPGPPIIVKLIPASGPDTGGTTVNVVGTDLTGAAVDFDGTAGTGLTVDPSGNLATVTSPAHTAGPAPVTITTPAGTSAAETFTFEAPPVILKPVDRRYRAADPLCRFDRPPCDHARSGVGRCPRQRHDRWANRFVRTLPQRDCLCVHRTRHPCRPAPTT